MKIYSLGQLPENIYASIGGKAKGLDILIKNGYRVPEGFVIADIENPSENDFDAIRRAFDGLQTDKVSVRSSASNEDGNEYSNAGQYETCLNVTADGLKEAVEKCLQSLNSKRAEAYSQSLLNGQKAEMNLVVQQMIDSKCAGVMFSTNPVAHGDTLIESVDGLGENLVSGSHSSYRYSIPKDRFSANTDGNLTKNQLRAIYEQGKKISELSGNEVDLEWAVDGNGELYWLQMRPITSLDDTSIDEFDPNTSLDNHLLTSRNIGEMMPGAVTPLSISTSVLAIDYGIRNMLVQIGSIKKVEDRPDYYTALSVDNHLFIDMTALHSMSKRVGMASPPAMNLSIMGEYREDYPPVEGKDAFFLIKFINMLKFAKYIFSSKKAKKSLVKLNDGLRFDEQKDAASLYRQIDEKLPAMNKALCHHYVCSSYSGAMNSALYMTISNDFEDKADYQAFISQLLSDIDGIESADILASLKALAKQIILQYPDAGKLNENQLKNIVTNPKNEKINGLYVEFLKKHGHRSIKEAEMRSKAWKHDTASLMRNLHTVIISYKDEEEKAPFDIEDHIKGFKKSKQGALRWIGGKARQAVIDREFSKSNIIKIIDKFKDEYAKLAKMLVADGLLADEDSIYFLTHKEIGQLLEGETRLKRKALSRRTLFNESEDLSFDDVYVGKPQPISAEADSDGQGFKGIPVCRGKIYGRARVVKNVSDAEKLQKGEVLVAPFTDIGWSPYYSLVSALVTEVGSALSHGAVVAREYCLPTIVNVKNATKLIKDGDYLCVDASHGNISIISKEEYEAKRSAA